MVSCGSFSSGGNASASPSAGEKGRKSVSQFPGSRLCRRRRRHTTRPPPSRRAAWISGTRSRSEVGLRRRGARGWEREGKCNAQPEVSPVPPPKRNPRSCLPCNSEGTHAPSLSPEIPASHTGKARSAGCSARSAARGPAPALAPRGRCPSPGQCERRAPAAASSFRGGRIPARCSRAPLARLGAPHLSTVTCRLRHQMSVLR